MASINWGNEAEVNALLRKGLLLANAPRGDAPSERYEYSDGYRRWEQKFLANPFGYMKTKSRPMWRRVLNAAAMLIITLGLLLGTLMLVNSDVRAAVIQWFVETFTTHDAYYFTGESEQPAKKDWEFTYLPEGYFQVEHRELGKVVIIRFEDTQGNNISLRVQPLDEGGAFQIDNEQMDIDETTISGNAAAVYRALVPDKPNKVTWIDEAKSIAFLLMSYEDCDTLIHIAEGMEYPD